ncbi:MAG TPA: SAVED domain-containing protein [Ktedonobacterales bacterium]|nr:SAVED domain-containing protein [Ktedonobacterales bacterium]
MAEQHAATVFLSYRRKDLEHTGEGEELSQVERIERYLKACGLRVWRDLTTMKDGEVFHADVASAIADCDVFLLYLTPRAIESEQGYIWTHEVSAALARERKGERIRIIPVFHGVKEDAVKAIADGLYSSLGYQPLADHEGIPLPEKGDEPLSQQSLRLIAKRVLKAGFEAYLTRIGAGSDHEAWLHFWAGPQYETLQSAHYDLELDWHDLFRRVEPTGELLYPTQDQWRDLFLPALDDMVDILNRANISKIVHVFSKVRYSAAVTFGFAFRNMASVQLHLERENARDGRQTWSTAVSPYDDEPLEEIPMPGFGRESLAEVALIEVAITSEISEQEARKDAQALGLLPRYRVQLKAKSPGRGSVKGAADAMAKAQQIRQYIHRLRKEHGVQHIHVFIAAPVELAILLGHQLNATGRITVYDYANSHYLAGPTLNS